MFIRELVSYMKFSVYPIKELSLHGGLWRRERGMTQKTKTKTKKRERGMSCFLRGVIECHIHINISYICCRETGRWYASSKLAPPLNLYGPPAPMFMVICCLFTDKNGWATNGQGTQLRVVLCFLCVSVFFVFHQLLWFYICDIACQ